MNVETRRRGLASNVTKTVGKVLLLLRSKVLRLEKHNATARNGNCNVTDKLVCPFMVENITQLERRVDTTDVWSKFLELIIVVEDTCALQRSAGSNGGASAGCCNCINTLDQRRLDSSVADRSRDLSCGSHV